MPSYRQRVVDTEIDDVLGALGAVVVEGPRACGKTWTAVRHASSEVRLDAVPRAAELAELDPRPLLAGLTPRLLDEWQLAPALWNAARREVDDRQKSGQFILTGSAQPPEDPARHSGAGRFGRVRMRPMALSESGESTGEVSLGAVFAGQPASGRSSVEALEYADLIVRGGWPGLVERASSAVRPFLAGYVDGLVEHDVLVAEARRRDPVRFRRFLQAYAQVVGGIASLSTIAARATEPGTRDGVDHDAGLHWSTADGYLDAARRLMVVEEVPAWSPRLRSRTRLAGAAKRHFVDPSLAAHLMGADALRLRSDLETMGFLFESLVTRDVQVYAQAMGASVFHYRDRDGALEIDLVLEKPDGAWMGIEVKLGDSRADDAAANLRAVAERRVARPPDALVVITGGAYAYRRADGVDVIPLAALRP